MHAFPRAYVLRQVVNHSTKKITRFSLYFRCLSVPCHKARPKTPTRGKSFALFLPYGPIWARALLFLSDFVYKIGRYKAVKITRINHGCVRNYVFRFNLSKTAGNALK